MRGQRALWTAAGGIALACMSVGGCGSSPRLPTKEPPRVVTVADGGQPITAAELDDLTRAFADRYVGLLYSVCDALTQDNADPVQRREAQNLLVDGATNIYDIASNADSFTRLLDLVVVTRLMRQVWVTDGRAELVFHDRAEPLKRALLHSQEEAKELAARILTTDQVRILDTLIVEWWEDNPDMIRSSFVRFSNFSVGRGRSAVSEVLAARGFFAEVGQAGQAVDEVRLLGERVFYQMKRMPTLLRWQAAAAKEDLLASPEFITALADLHRLTEQAEKLPAHVAAEREAIFTGIDSQLANADRTISKANILVTDATALVAAMDPTAKSLDQAIRSADTMFARYDAWVRWTYQHDPKPFDIREYTEMVRATDVTTQTLNDTLKTSADLLASADWNARIEELNRAADGRIDRAAEEARQLLNGLYRRGYIALGVIVVLLVGLRVASLLFARRRTTVAVLGPGGINSDEVPSSTSGSAPSDRRPREP